MIYADDPQNPGKRVSILELQRRNPLDLLPPYIIKDWMKINLWTTPEALYLLAGCEPPLGVRDINVFRFFEKKEYLDGTSDERLHYGAIAPKGYPNQHLYDDPNANYLNLTHPLKDSIEGNLRTLQTWLKNDLLTDTKSPEEWIKWAASKIFEPYWLEYAEAKQSAPAAPKVKAVQGTSPSGDVISGKMPKVRHGQIAVKAAWQIESKSGKLATAEEVIKIMQSLVDTNDYPELLEKISHGIKYVTKSGKANDYDVNACKKTLERWNKTRQ